MKWSFPWKRIKSTEAAGAAPGPEPAAPPSKPIRPEDYVGSDPSRHEQMVREGFVAAAKRHLRAVPMAEDVVAMYFCMLDRDTPLWVKGVAGAALAYFVLPLDSIPDILPIVGMSDDVAVLSVALTTISAHITPAHRARASAWLRDEKIIDVTPRAQKA